jgi:hypothetical protein
VNPLDGAAISMVTRTDALFLIDCDARQRGLSSQDPLQVNCPNNRENIYNSAPALLPHRWQHRLNGRVNTLTINAKKILTLGSRKLFKQRHL